MAGEIAQFVMHRKESCPMVPEIVLNNQAIMNIQESLDKIEKRLDCHATKAEEQLSRIIASFEERYVTKEAFSPVQKIVYGLVGIVLFSALASLLALILPHIKA